MGEQPFEAYSDPQRLRRFMQSLLNDVLALEKMLADGRIETGVRRIGAEQELCLIDSHWNPAPVAEEILPNLSEAFTPELGRFQLEFNLVPIPFRGNCLSEMETRMNERLDEARAAAREAGYDVLMTGILPTIRKTDLDLANMMPRPRYYALNEAMKRLRRGEFELRLTGTDEVIVKHDSVMMEACNTSCQFHFQVDPAEFARYYNVAQIVTSPVLAAAVNSPMLFGRRLWKETRIALFQQAVDTRPMGHHLLERSARVAFGNAWVRESVLEIFREDIARFRVVLGIDIDEDPFAVLAEGRVPKLKALQLHNGTVYRWNRPCYGVLDGVPTLRIENRALPAGPSVMDQVANGAFWYGLLLGYGAAHPDIRRVFSFDTTKTNFLAAARQGLDAQFEWIGQRTVPARDLILQELLPVAREGLGSAQLDPADVDRFLGVIEDRVTSGRTGSHWILQSFTSMGEDRDVKLPQKLGALVAAMLNRQVKGEPVHKWKLARLDEAEDWKNINHCVEQYMTTELFTVHEDELIDLVANVMDWRHVRHVPVEDSEGKLVGIVSYRTLLRLLARTKPGQFADRPVPVKELMTRDIVTASPKTTTLEAIELMRSRKVACLPVVTEDNRLVGIVSERDFLHVAGELLLASLRGS